MIELQTKYQKAIVFAAKRHAVKNQVIPGSNLPYVVHLSNVAMEILVAAQKTERFDSEFAIQVALLHDVLEDTATEFDELAHEFGNEVAQAVKALTKSRTLPKADRMTDSLNRIMLMPKEVWAVKLADRITNLQPPPEHWSIEKITDYHKQALLIADSLKGGNEYLENRLQEKISFYSKYCLPVTK